MTVIELGELSHRSEPVPPPPTRPVGRPLRVALVAVLALVSLGAAAPPPQRALRLATVSVSQPSVLLAGDLLVLVEGLDDGQTIPRHLAGVELTGGRTRWRLPLPEGTQVSTLDRVGEAVAVTVESGEGPTTLLLDPADGRVRWRQDGSAVSTGDGGLLLTSSGPTGSAARRIEPASGAVRWSVTAGPGEVLYRYRGPVLDSLALVESSGRVQVRDAGTGERRAGFTVAAVRADGSRMLLALAGGLLLAEPEPGRVGAYGLDDGALRWTAPLHPEAPFVNDCGAVVCLGQPDGARLLDPATGQLRGTVRGWMPGLPIGDRLLAYGVRGDEDALALLDGSTGRVLVELGRWGLVPGPVGQETLATRAFGPDRRLLARLDVATGEAAPLDVLPGRWNFCEHRDRILICWGEGPPGQVGVWRLPG